MPDFALRGLTLTLPDTALRGGLEQALASGRYEGQEADAILRHLRPGDRFLDLGAGIGFLCALAARVVGEAAVTGVEAGPETAALARANLAANGFPGVRLLQGAVTAGTAGEVEFGQRPAFWASAVKGAQDWPANARILRVPALPIGPLLAEARPTVLSCDIEGAELEVLAQPLRGVRLVVAEIHPAVYGPEGTRHLFDALSAQGFAYLAEGSRGATVVFGRDRT
ncbi:FkbM family methyltransferase [Rhodobacter sp. SGA-6-6]|uniref:FkbM family methyltransferase n=1 Tax=Rhodobacter sp. SGA-6-6 TaxID=2710882 RepID=UPI0013EB907A|nr:FkbM family methyltransferase [Rhodobacter sp. SGA-6-6]NGM47381.1 FkbM family methyltransferase [Rhodobacter sp. SGA-6-6]